MIINENNNTTFSKAIIQEIIHNNIDTFIISPGSRSTPLTVAIARIKAQNKNKINTIVSIDERSSGFFALGYARYQKKKNMNPAVLICTSGSAVANYLPAVIEASQDFIPMIIISADRPPELLDSGANQAILQKNIFQNYVTKSIELECPTNESSIASILSAVNNAIYHAHTGPVHINIMFREPLTPNSKQLNNEVLKELYSLRKEPSTLYLTSKKRTSKKTIYQIQKILLNKENTILVVGRIQSKKKLKTIVQFAEQYNLPILADVLSQLRNYSSKNIISYFHHLLPLLSQKEIPENIIHIGGQITSKSFLQLIENNSFDNYIVVKDHAKRHDPAHKVTHRIQADVLLFCKDIILNHKPNHPPNNSYLSLLKNKSEKLNSIITKTLNEFSMKNSLNEMTIVHSILKNLTENTNIFLGNSLSVRMIDYFAYHFTKEKKIKKIFFDANRGASGIDGNLSTGLGYALSSKRNTIILLGDLSFIHDLNSLALLKNIKTPITIIIVNNNGGGIFQYLPISKHTDVFEEYFIVPHNLTFNNICKMFSIKHFKINQQKEFDMIFQKLQNQKIQSVIEVIVDNQKSYNDFQKLQDSIKNEFFK